MSGNKVEIKRPKVTSEDGVWTTPRAYPSGYGHGKITLVDKILITTIMIILVLFLTFAAYFAFTGDEWCDCQATPYPTYQDKNR